MIKQGLTFDDVLLVPKKGILESRKLADITMELYRGMKLKVPIISANMDTVTEHKMAFAMAINGGVGIIHRFMSIEDEKKEVEKVKRSYHTIIKKPYIVHPELSIAKLKEKMEVLGVKGFPVVDNDEVVGIVTWRDIRFEKNENKEVKDVMTKEFIWAEDGISLEEAREILNKKKIDRLPLLKGKKLAGLITSKDILWIENNKIATRDRQGRLVVGAAVGVKDYIERTNALVEAEVDFICIDVAHGHSEQTIKAIKEIKNEFDIPIFAGNVATRQGTEELIEAGADVVKVGIGPGANCITRVVTGFGVPQLTAIMECSESAEEHGVGIIADGGIKSSGDMVKAFAAGARAVMVGYLLAGTEESPGTTIIRKGKRYKILRGMASASANIKKRREEGKKVHEDETEYTAEGVESLVEVKGKVKDVLKQFVNGIKSGVSYGGVKRLSELKENAEFIRMTKSGVYESKSREEVEI